MKFTIGKWFCFEAAHSLPALPAGHKCRNVHGHSYKVHLELSGELDEFGFVTDYGDLWQFQKIIDVLDHAEPIGGEPHLNAWLAPHPSTAEWLAQRLFEAASVLYRNLTVEAVTVKETEKTYARYGR